MTPVTHRVVGEAGVLTFDGEVIEAFGFSREHSARIHVALLAKIDVSDGGRFMSPGINFESSAQVMPLGTRFTAEEMAGPEMKSLLDAIRAAAPQVPG